MARTTKGYLSEKKSSFRNRIFFIDIDTRYQMIVFAMTYGGQKNFIWISEVYIHIWYGYRE